MCGVEVMPGDVSPITHVSRTRTKSLVWNAETGWISWQIPERNRPLPLCWMPVERRGYKFTCFGTTAVLGARQGTLTILDFSDVIAMIGDADQAPFT
jgi:hypothetical protein